MHKHTYKNSRECVEQADRPVPPPPPLTYSWQQNSPVYATYVQTLTEWDFQEKSIHSEVHPPTLVSYLHKQTQKTGSVRHKKLEQPLTPWPPLPHLRLLPSSGPEPRLCPDVNRRGDKTTSSQVSSKQLEESFGLLQVHLLPAGQTPVLLSGHLQGFLWEQPCTPSA